MIKNLEKRLKEAEGKAAKNVQIADKSRVMSEEKANQKITNLEKCLKEAEEKA